MDAKNGKFMTGIISYGDRIHMHWDEDTGLNTPDKVDRVFRQWAENGVDRIQWRVFKHGGERHHFSVFDDAYGEYAGLAADTAANFGAWWDFETECELRWPIECAHNYGMEIYARRDPFNLGAPPGAYVEAGVVPSMLTLPNHRRSGVRKDWGMYSRFCAQHPEYEVVDRTRKHRHYGILELAYPEARKYLLDSFVEPYVRDYDIDGFCMDTRTECISPLHADRFGFNEPIVEEYQRRYGVNILKSDFDLEAWRSLRGEYLTRFVREVRELTSKYGKKFTLLTQRGDHLGHPIGNVVVDWRAWIKEGLIDDLGIGIQGWCWGQQPYGFITSPNTVEEDIRDVYGPFLKDTDVGLFIRDKYYDDETFFQLAGMPELTGLIVAPWKPREWIHKLKYGDGGS